MKASVRKTARCGVLAAIQRAARSCAALRATGVRDHVPGRDERRRDRGRRQDERGDGVDRRRRSQPPRIASGDPHHLEVLVHVELDGAGHDEVRHQEEGDRPGRQEDAGRRAGRHEGQQRRAGAAGPGWWRRRRGPAPIPSSNGASVPARDEPDGAALALQEHRPDDERKGEHDRGEEERRVAEPAAPSPRPPRHGVQQDEQVGRREEVEVERARGEPRATPASPIPAGAAAERDAHEQEHGEEPGQPERGGPVREEPGPQDRGDLELRAARLPGVVVGELLDELPRAIRGPPARRGRAGSSPSRRR